MEKPLDILQKVWYNKDTVKEMEKIASRNDKKKLTFLDHWYKWYTDGARHRQHKSDKRLATRKFRKISKEMCKKSID